MQNVYKLQKKEQQKLILRTHQDTFGCNTCQMCVCDVISSVWCEHLCSHTKHALEKFAEKMSGLQCRCEISFGQPPLRLSEGLLADSDLHLVPFYNYNSQINLLNVV